MTDPYEDLADLLCKDSSRSGPCLTEREATEAELEEATRSQAQRSNDIFLESLRRIFGKKGVRL